MSNADRYPVAAHLVKCRNNAAAMTPTRPEALGCFFVLGDEWTVRFLREYLTVIKGPARPFVNDLSTPLAVLDNMPIVHRSNFEGVSVFMPQGVPKQTEEDVIKLRAIYNGIAQGQA